MHVPVEPSFILHGTTHSICVEKFLGPAVSRMDIGKRNTILHTQFIYRSKKFCILWEVRQRIQSEMTSNNIYIYLQT